MLYEVFKFKFVFISSMRLYLRETFITVLSNTAKTFSQTVLQNHYGVYNYGARPYFHLNCLAPELVYFLAVGSKSMTVIFMVFTKY